MTKQEYITKHTLVCRMNSRLIVWLGIFIAAVTVMIPVLDWIERNNDSLKWLRPVLAAAFSIIALGGGLAGATRVMRHQQREGLLCHHCGKLIQSSQLAIATGNCGFCGEGLFEQ